MEGANIREEDLIFKDRIQPQLYQVPYKHDPCIRIADPYPVRAGVFSGSRISEQFQFLMYPFEPSQSV